MDNALNMFGSYNSCAIRICHLHGKTSFLIECPTFCFIFNLSYDELICYLLLKCAISSKLDVLLLHACLS